MIGLNIIVAFTGGIVSFLAPCVLPLIPGYLAYLAGTSVGNKTKRIEIFINSIFFVLGFSVVFALLGVLLNSLLKSVGFELQIWLSRIGGIIIIFFGLYLMGLIHIKFFEQEHKFKIHKFKSKYITSFLFGSAFAAGWTPCVGAALAAILTLAATHPGQSFGLLFAYSLGLGIPFLIVGFFAGEISRLISKAGPYLKYVNIIFGILLIIFGILIFTQTLTQLFPATLSCSNLNPNKF